jgi:hypothetical protein
VIDEVEIAHRVALDSHSDMLSTELGMRILQKTIEDDKYDYVAGLDLARHFVMCRIDKDGDVVSPALKSFRQKNIDKRYKYDEAFWQSF